MFVDHVFLKTILEKVVTWWFLNDLYFYPYSLYLGKLFNLTHSFSNWVVQPPTSGVME